MTNVPICTPEATASQVRAMLAGRHLDSATDVTVCADGDGSSRRLLELIPLESIVAAESQMLTGDLMDPTRP